jgi:hypothetical protein
MTSATEQGMCRLVAGTERGWYMSGLLLRYILQPRVSMLCSCSPSQRPPLALQGVKSPAQVDMQECAVHITSRAPREHLLVLEERDACQPGSVQARSNTRMPARAAAAAGDGLGGQRKCF